MLLGLFLGIAIMIILVMKTKTHTFIALLLAALITGLIGRMSPTDAINAIQDGFGNTLKSTGIIIGLGVMMGGILEKTGAAERLAYTFIKTIGKGKEEWALGITGWLVSIPVFADSAIVIFAPLCKAMSRVTGKSVIGLALALACGLQCTHVMVPPTPGPLTAAGMFGVDVGQMILAGAAMSIPIFIAAICYAQWIGKRIYQIPQEDGTFERKEYKKEYKLNFGVYYTPAENLCYTAMNKFKAKYGIIENVSDKEYFTNSMHVPVWKKISPFEKIDIESQLTGYSNAGCITYVELPSTTKHNIEALETIVNYAMDKDIPYFAINVPNDTCNNCGYTDEINDVCPMCGSSNISRLRRVTGYLTGNYTTAFNEGKQCEVKDRQKHDGIKVEVE